MVVGSFYAAQCISLIVKVIHNRHKDDYEVSSSLFVRSYGSFEIAFHSTKKMKGEMILRAVLLQPYFN